MKSTRGTKQNEKIRVAEIPAGVIGLGLMGRSIVTCLLASGHPVIGITSTKSKISTTKRQVLALLKELQKEGILKEDPGKAVERLTVSSDYSALANAGVVVESIIESIEAKKLVIRGVEEVVSPDALLGTNTSAIPVSILQEGALHPERIMGLHWAEPAHVTRFMEIICGNQTLPENAARAMALAARWGKEPSLLRRDIRGFITNRCMYALLREAFYLVESGYATVEDVDRSLRNDFGYWILFAGVFRFMDLTGIPAYAAVMKDLNPELNNSTEVPALMKKVVDSGARGVSNAKGFYSYTPEQAKRWEKLFLKFSYDVRALAQKYPGDIGNRTR